MDEQIDFKDVFKGRQSLLWSNLRVTHWLFVWLESNIYSLEPFKLHEAMEVKLAIFWAHYVDLKNEYKNTVFHYLIHDFFIIRELKVIKRSMQTHYTTQTQHAAVIVWAHQETGIGMLHHFLRSEKSCRVWKVDSSPYGLQVWMIQDYNWDIECLIPCENYKVI